jgi:hypothetical protein
MTAARRGKRFDLGVLLVHGIGAQSSGDTLTRWGDDILQAIAPATKSQVSATVERASIPPPSDSRCAQMVVRLDSEGGTERWLFAEGWWAQSFSAPTYRELVSWSFRALPWGLAIRVAQRHWQAAADPSRGSRLEFLKAFGLLFAALALSPLFILLLSLTLLLGLIPIPQLRSIILLIQSTLTATVGDSLAFVESPVRSALIRTRILEGLKHLTRLCNRTIVIAHSQGAAATLRVLREQGEEPARPMPDTLLTFGAGINQLVSLEVLAQGAAEKMGRNPTYWALAAIAAMAVIAGWFYNAFRQGLTVIQLLEAAAFYVLMIVAVTFVAWVGKDKVKSAAGRRAMIVVAVLFFLGAIGGGFYLAERVGLPFGPITFLGGALVVLIGALFQILSDETKNILTNAVQRPDGLERWIDLYASDDPVPNGPILKGDAEVVDESLKIFNRGSMFEDHTCYWENLDGFVLRVVRECARAAQSSWRECLPEQKTSIDKRAEWRTRYLRISRWTIGAFWLPILAMLCIRWGDRVWLPDDASRWLSAAAATWLRFSILTVAVLFCARLVSSLLQWPWRWWTRYEQKRHLRGEEVSGTPWTVLAAIGVSNWILIAGVWAVVSRENPARTRFDDVLGLTFIAAFLSIALFRWRKPPPEPGV